MPIVKKFKDAEFIRINEGIQCKKLLQKDDLDDSNKDFLEINRRLSEKWPIITEIKEPPSDAKEWEGKPNKKDLIEEE